MGGPPLTAGLLAVGVFLGGMLVLLGGIRLFYSGSMLCRESVGSVNDLRTSSAEIGGARGSDLLPGPGRLALRDGSQVWTAAPGGVGGPGHLRHGGGGP
jgi:hypothetical protein